MSEENKAKMATVSGFTSLHSAALLNDLERANFLLDAGEDIDTQSEEGLTPLMEALCEGDGDFIGPDVARLLIQYGADLSLQDKSGATALEYVNNYFEAAIQHQDIAKIYLGHKQRDLIELVRCASIQKL